jgi:hypothetical protein
MIRRRVCRIRIGTVNAAVRRVYVRARRGQSLVEFALVALVMYMILAAILTFGHALYVAQGLQQAADLGAREISRTPLPAVSTFEDALTDADVREMIFDDAWLVIDLEAFYMANPDGNIFTDLVPSMPLLNQQLVTVMIVDRPDIDGDGTPDEWLLRYPGALLTRGTLVVTPLGGVYPDGVATRYTVGIPVVLSRAADGVETIRWVPVVEEIENATNPDPFSLVSDQRGIVALRINFPFQSASMSSFRHDETAADYPFEATIGRPNAADDGGVIELNPGDRPGDLTGTPLEGPELYAGTYGGQYGLGAQGALGSQAMTGGRPVRPYRRVISAQAIYRREVFE